MSPLPSSLLSAARSGEIRGSYLAVFVELHEVLDADEYRTVKAWHIAARLHMDQSNVYAALDRLVSHGYLECGPCLAKARTYRLATPDQRVA